MSSSNSTPPPLQTRSYIGGWRFLLVIVLLGIVFVILVSRLFTLQVIQGAEWDARAFENRVKEINDPAPRGIIYDRNGVILARNIASYNIVITPADLPNDVSDIDRVFRAVSELIGVPVNAGTVEDAKRVAVCVEGPGIAQMVALGESNAPYSPVRIKCNVSEQLAMIVRQKAVDLPGVSVEIEPVRDYPTGYITSNIIGFLGPIPANQVEYYIDRGYVVGRDKVGYAGVESSLQDVLGGINGIRVVERDVAGQELRNIEAPIDPIPGNNVYLTIDTRLQKAAQAALEGQINFWNSTLNENRISSGVAIAMNPKTGEILAMVQYPSYENNRLARIIPAYYYNQISQDPRRPMLNYAISAEYPPGSTFKLTTATGALNEGVVTVDQIIDAPGQITLCERFSPNQPCTEANQRPFVDWIFEKRPEGFGKIDFYHCIAWSSNVCFYKLGGGYEDEIPEGLGPLRHAEYARALGYALQTGIELLGEADGLIPTPQWKRINLGETWSTGDTYIASVGQGYVLATPLQVLLSAATLANNGVLVKPTLVHQVTDVDGNTLTKYYNPPNPYEYSVTDTPRDETSFQISPFSPHERWNITTDNLIKAYVCSDGYCEWDGESMKNVTPYVIQQVRTGMRLAAIDPQGTLNKDYSFGGYPVAVAGKTGTAEYCDDVARKAGRCDFGLWPTHAWTVAFAPFDDPEIAIVGFLYNGGEGGSVAAPLVKDIMDAYFAIKAIDAGQAPGGGG